MSELEDEIARVTNGVSNEDQSLAAIEQMARAAGKFHSCLIESGASDGLARELVVRWFCKTMGIPY